MAIPQQLVVFWERQGVVGDVNKALGSHRPGFLPGPCAKRPCDLELGCEVPILNPGLVPRLSEMTQALSVERAWLSPRLASSTGTLAGRRHIALSHGLACDSWHPSLPLPEADWSAGTRTRGLGCI